MSVNTFITDLQNSNNSRKLRWLVGLTVVTVAVIIGIWVLASPNDPSLSGDLVRKEDQPTFFEKIAISTGNIVSVLRTKTANTINYFSNKFNKTNTIEIKAEDKHEAPSAKSETTLNDQTL